MRTKPPKVVSDWQEMIKTHAPKCCHTCHHYDSNGICKVFQSEPPEAFTQEVDQCGEWLDEVPF